MSFPWDKRTVLSWIIGIIIPPVIAQFYCKYLSYKAALEIFEEGDYIAPAKNEIPRPKEAAELARLLRDAPKNKEYVIVAGQV